MKSYIGDGCFAEITTDGIVLTTSNGIEETNRVVLEPEVWGALVRFVANASTRRAEEPNGPAPEKP